MMNTHSNRGRLTAALVLIGLGTLFFLGNMGLFEIGDFFATFWPLVIIALGISRLLSPNSKDVGGAVFFLGLGALFLAGNLGMLRGDVLDYWPVVLILLGVWILFRPRANYRNRGKQEKYPHHDPDFERFSKVSESQDADGRIEIVAIFGSQERPVLSHNFTGGDITVIFSGSTLDLRQVQPAAGEMYLEITAVFSGLDIIVPQHWQIDVSMTPLFGSVEDKRRNFAYDPAAPVAHKLIISGICIFTGIEITS